MAMIDVRVMAPARVVLTGEADQLQVPGSEGYLGILPEHANFTSAMGVGELAVFGGNNDGARFFVSGGYVEVHDAKVTVLADVIEKPEDIDFEAAEIAQREAKKTLEISSNDQEKVAHAQKIVLEADARLAFRNRR